MKFKILQFQVLRPITGSQFVAEALRRLRPQFEKRVAREILIIMAKKNGKLKKSDKKAIKAAAKETKRAARIQKQIDKLTKRIDKLTSKKVKLETKRDTGNGGGKKEKKDKK